MTFLEGTWQSNKELTVSKFTDNPALTEKRRRFLTENLGQLTLVFQGSKAAAFFGNAKEAEWGTFEVLSSNRKQFTISVSNQSFENRRFTYYWAGDCFFLKQPDYGYDEYFCKAAPVSEAPE